jgi:hypothetical protein
LLAKDVGTGVQIEDYVALHGWLVRVDNIVRTVFGPASAHFIQLAAMLAGKPSCASEVKGILGILNGALSDLEGGFLANQELLIAGAAFYSVLEQARHLVDSGFKDPAGVLCRVVIEDCLRRLSRESFPITTVASVVRMIEDVERFMAQEFDV